jgi:hypothetical protein
VFTADFVKRAEDDMRRANRKDLAGFLAEYDTIPDKPIEVRNEKIDGNKAVAEIRGGAYLKWTQFTFEKEDGKWKFNGGSADLDAVKESVSNSNSAK